MRIRPGTAQGRQVAAEALSRGIQLQTRTELEQAIQRADDAEAEIKRMAIAYVRKDHEVVQLRAALAEAIRRAKQDDS